MTLRSHPVLRAFALLGVAIFLGCSPSYAGQHMARDLSGTVTDGRREPLRGAVVQVHSESTGTVVSYITDRTGKYSFKRLESDLDYTVWATWNGTRSSVKKLSVFDNDKPKVLDFEITPNH